MSWEIEYYLDKRGKNTVEEVLKSLQPKGKATAKIQHIINTSIKGATFFKERGNAFKKVGDFWQIRGSDCRVLGRYENGKRVFVLLHAFIKKCNDTPPEEIEKAETKWNDYLSRSTKTKSK